MKTYLVMTLDPCQCFKTFFFKRTEDEDEWEEAPVLLILLISLLSFGEQTLRTGWQTHRPTSLHKQSSARLATVWHPLESSGHLLNKLQTLVSLF